jgi:hypothetical protein
MNWTSRLAALCAAMALLAAMTVQAEAKIDKREQAQKWAIAEKLVKDPKCDVPSQVDAVKALIGLADREIATKLAAYWAECDKSGAIEYDNKGKPKKPDGDVRPRDAYKVAMEILRVIKSVNEPEEALKFKADMFDRQKFPLRVRSAMFDSIGACASGNEDCFKLIIETAREGKDTDMRVLAIVCLRPHYQKEGVFDLALGLLNDRSWRVRDVAVDLIVDCSSLNKDRAILALINRLSVEEGKLKLSLSKALTKITNEKLGTDSDAWIDWFKETKRQEQGLPPKKGDGGKGTRAKRIFDTETFSDRYIFIIDASHSMTEPITPEELEKLKKQLTRDPNDPNPDKRRPLDWTKISCKLDLAREEMIRSLEVLDPKVCTFTIIKFADDIAVWSDELRPTEPKVVEEAATWLRGLKGKKRTNISAAIDAAFDMSERLAGIDPAKLPKKDKDKGKGVVTGPHADEFIPDTIFLYTDGYATTGKFGGSTDELKAVANGKDIAVVYRAIMTDFLAEILDRNRICRITINSVGVGKQDDWFLGNLAKQNGGSYLALAPEKHTK